MYLNENSALRRQVYWTSEFAEFYESLTEKVKTKFDYVLSVVKTERIVSTKFVKHLENTDFYEIRVSVGNNEYRTILFTMDNDNIMLATEITLIVAFMKKATKDYHRYIKQAKAILKRISYDEDRQK